MANEHDRDAQPDALSVRDIEERISGERLRTLVFEENERFNRLIRNLYLKFRLDRYPPDELYNHICREVAQYFHADVCSLMLLRHEEVDKDGSGRKQLHPFLELKGAFGPWEEALRPKKARRKQTVRYDLYVSTAMASVTARAYHKHLPSLASSRQDLELIRMIGKPVHGKAGRWRSNAAVEAPARHLVWHYNNLYYTCRNVIQIPIRRPDSTLPPIALLKIENRTPRGIRGFSATAGPELLFFDELWALAALQPYLKDLTQSEDVFRPVHNNEAWRLRYQDNPPALEYFESLRVWLGKRQQELTTRPLEADGKAGPKEREKEERAIQKEFKVLEQQLSWLLRFLSEAETLLQSLAYAHAVLNDMGRKRWIRDDTPPASSIFNAHNLGLTLVKAKEDLKNWLPDDAARDFSTLREQLGIPDDSIVNALHRQLESLDVMLPERGRESCDARTPKLVADVTEDILGKSTVAKDEPRSIRQFLGSNSAGRFNFDLAIERLLTVLQGFAESLHGANVRLPDPAANREAAAPQSADGETRNIRDELFRRAYARLQAEQRVAQRAANEVLDRGRTQQQALESVRAEIRELIKRERDEQEGLLWLKTAPSAADDDSFVSKRIIELLLLSRWSASASRAHTFDETDVYRIMFIAGNVAQVLDNHLMQQARQRQIPCGYGDFARFGVDPQTLEWLHEVNTVSLRLALILSECFNREWMQLEEVVIQPPCVGMNLNDDLLASLRLTAPAVVVDAGSDQPRSAAIINLIHIRERPCPTSVTMARLSQWTTDQSELDDRCQPFLLPAAFPRYESDPALFAAQLEVFLVNLRHEVESSGLAEQAIREELELLKQLKQPERCRGGQSPFLRGITQAELKFMLRRAKPPYVLGLRLSQDLLFDSEPHWTPRWVLTVRSALQTLLAKFENE